RALFQLGQAGGAMSQFQKVLELQPNDADIHNVVAWMLATSPEATVRDGARAIELARRANQLSAGDDPMILRTLAAAYAEAGRFPEAVSTAQRALQLATARTNVVLAN